MLSSLLIQATAVAALTMAPQAAPTADTRPKCQGEPATVVLAWGERPTRGDDVIVGTRGRDVIRGLGGDDLICARGGDDVVRGGPGRDVILGGGGDDVLRGGSGADVVRGGGGADRLVGGSGHDVLDGGPGPDRLRGGRGVDRASYAGAPRAVHVNLAVRAAQDTGRGLDRLAGIEHLEGSPHHDTLIGNDGPNLIRGLGGDDTLVAKGGDDLLDGGDGQDACSTGHGEDVADCEDVVGFRIMIVGDSISSGSDGDWTWRYRLWQHFQRKGVAVDFVGHRDTLVNTKTWVHDSYAYADPDFDRDHAARSGGSMFRPERPIARLVRDHAPDVVVQQLGINDLLAHKRSVAENTELLREFVIAARSSDPLVTQVVSRVPSAIQPSVAHYNTSVDPVVAELDRPDARVVVAPLDEGYDPVEHNYDDLHPNSRGEMRIAAAVADTLARVGIGTPHLRPLPHTPVGPRWVSKLRATPGPHEVTLRWRTKPGVTHNYLWRRDATAGEDWVRLGVVHGTSFTSTLLYPGHRYEYMLQPAKWRAESELRSNVAAAVPLPRDP